MNTENIKNTIAYFRKNNMICLLFLKSALHGQVRLSDYGEIECTANNKHCAGCGGDLLEAGPSKSWGCCVAQAATADIFDKLEEKLKHLLLEEFLDG